MIHQKISISNKTDAYMTTYVLDDGEYERKGLVKPAVVICPGGGYTYVSKNEGEPVALFFNRHGYHAFVVNYSVKIDHPFPEALEELAAAMAVVREHQEEWQISDVYVAGFSAGGNLALSLGVYYTENWLLMETGYTVEQIRPDKLILGYPAVSLYPVREGGKIPPEMEVLMEQGVIPDFRGPGIRQILLGKEEVSKEEMEELNLLTKLKKTVPPTFIWGSVEDTLIPVSDCTGLAEGLCRLGVPCELHLYGHGPHGMSLCDESVKNAADLERTNMGNWTDLCINWLKAERDF